MKKENIYFILGITILVISLAGIFLWQKNSYEKIIVLFDESLDQQMAINMEISEKIVQLQKDNKTIKDQNATLIEANERNKTILSNLGYEKNDILYFYGANCRHCLDINQFLMVNEIAKKIKYQSLEITYNPSNAQKMNEKAKECGISQNQIGVPLVYYEGKCYSGEPDVKTFFTRIAAIDPIDWKIHSSDTGKFQIQYPSDWLATFGKGEFAQGVLLTSPKTKKQSQQPGFRPTAADINIYTFNSFSEMQGIRTANNLVDYLSANKRNTSNEKGIVLNFVKTNFSNVDAYEANLNIEGANYYAIYFSKGSLIYEILFESKSSKEYLTAIEKQILISFKFIN